MATRGAQPGNRNAARGKEWRDALRRALAQYENDTVKRGEALLAIANKLLDACMRGEMDAIRELGNRLDGKPAQSIIGAGDHEPPIKIHGTVTFVEEGRSALTD